MQPQARHIAHLDLDSFYVSVELLRNPSLRGKPVLIGGASDRGVVASCSYEARKFGIHSAMPMKKARKLCKDAIIIGGDMEMYVKYSSLVTEIMKDSLPLFEKSSIDEFYADLTGMDRFFGCMKFMQSVKEKIRKETGLPTTFALSSNKLISKVATNEVKPDGQIEILPGTEKTFLAPLSITKIPGIGKKTASILMTMGIETVQALSETPVQMLENVLGKSGVEFWHKANGIDESPVIPYHEQKSVSTENTFPQDTRDVHFLHSEIVRMVEKVAFDLRSHNRLTGCVTIKLKYADFEVFTKQKTIPYTNADHILTGLATDIFDNLYDTRKLVRLIGVRFTHLIAGNYQISLFDDAPENIKLYQAIDSVKNRFGEKLLIKAAGMKHDNRGS